jgi:hypothetical protein
VNLGERSALSARLLRDLQEGGGLRPVVPDAPAGVNWIAAACPA